MRQFYVYILSSHSRTLYVGVTNDLLRRRDQHRNCACEFTARYRISRLVYFEISQNVRSAIEREKEIKAALLRMTTNYPLAPLNPTSFEFSKSAKNIASACSPNAGS